MRGCPSQPSVTLGLLAPWHLSSADRRTARCRIQELLELLEKCFPGQFLSAHFNWVCTWQLDNRLIFISVITSPCKSRRCHHQEGHSGQPDQSGPVAEVGSPILTAMQALALNRAGERVGADSSALQILHSPDLSMWRRVTTANIYSGHTISQALR